MISGETQDYLKTSQISKWIILIFFPVVEVGGYFESTESPSIAIRQKNCIISPEAKKNGLTLCDQVPTGAGQGHCVV